MVLTRAEVGLILEQLCGTVRLMATLLYGSGLRLLECARLRIKDVDFGSNQITVRAGKGDKDRVTLLPDALKDELAGHSDVSTTMIYTHVLNRGPGAVRSPVDQLLSPKPGEIRLNRNSSINVREQEARKDGKPIGFSKLK